MGPASIGYAGSELGKMFKSEVNGEFSAVSQDTTTAVVWRSTTALSLSRSDAIWKHSRDVPRFCDGRATASPAVRKRMTGKYRRVQWTWLLGENVKSSGIAWLCARHEVWTQVWRDTTSGSHQNSTGRLRWKMCRSNDFTSTSPQYVLLQSFSAITNLLHRARMLWVLEHTCDSWLRDVPKIQTIAAQHRTAWAVADFSVFGSPCRNERCFWLRT